MKCNICPRRCGTDREMGGRGACNSPDSFSVSKIMLHQWEEPCLVGDRGAGAIFFSGCNLGCIYCQNRKISHGGTGQTMSAEQLKREIFSLVDQGAACIEFVTPTHYAHSLASLLSAIKSRIPVPTVYNSGGYDNAETLKLLDGLIDIYMPDFKYFSPELAKKYSRAEDYPSIALSALREMLKQTGTPSFSDDVSKRLLRGVIIRHLILPSHRSDSENVLTMIAREIGAENVILSLMGQYTPDFYLEYEAENGKNEDYKNLRRRITSFEYNQVLKKAEELGFRGYMQDISSANAKFTPEF